MTLTGSVGCDIELASLIEAVSVDIMVLLSMPDICARALPANAKSAMNLTAIFATVGCGAEMASNERKVKSGRLGKEIRNNERTDRRSDRRGETLTKSRVESLRT